MAGALGQMPNAPLIYVLAQVVYTRVPKMGNLWEDFHQAIFEHYPISTTEHIRDIQLGQSSEPSVSEVTRWHMVSRDKSEGVILGPDSLVFHATSYQTSAVFFEKLNNVLSGLKTILPKNVDVNRLGLRYIDLLLPTDNLSVDEQVAGKLGSIPLEDAGCNFKKLEEVTSYSTPEGGQLIVRHRQSTEKDILPGDLFPNNLKPASRLEQNVPDGSVVGLMDYDHYVQLNIEFDTVGVMGMLKSMHSTSSRAFALTTTDEAKKFWNEG